MQLKKTCIATAAVGAIVSGSLVAAVDASADPVIAGTYNTVAPVRVLNTLAGTGAAKAAVGPGKSITFDAAGTLGTKLVSAEALTLQAVDPTQSGYLIAYTGGTPEPAISTLNYRAGGTTANQAIIGYGGSGTVTVHNVSSGTVQLVADLTGYWTGGSVADDTAGAYTPLPSGARLLDTRTTTTNLPAGGDLSVPVLGQGGVPETGVSAVAVNITVPSPTLGGYVTATASPTDQDADSRTSDLTFRAGQTRAVLEVVPVDPDTGAISLFNASGGSVGAVVDVAGYFSDGEQSDDGSFVPSTTYRNSDTRTTNSPVGPHKTVTLDLGVGGSPSLFKAVAANLTVVSPTAAGWVLAWNGSSPRPPTSSVNFVAKQTTANSILTALNSNGTISVYNGSSGTINLVLDVHGFVLNDVSGDAAAVTNRIHTALGKARRAAVARTAR